MVTTVVVGSVGVTTGFGVTITVDFVVVAARYVVVSLGVMVLVEDQLVAAGTDIATCFIPSNCD